MITNISEEYAAPSFYPKNESSYLFIKLHAVTFQKTAILIGTAVILLNFKYVILTFHPIMLTGR